jgi:hypothetical protein
LIRQQNPFNKQSIHNKMTVCASYEVVEMTEEHRSFFTASEFVKCYLLAVAEEV